MTGGGSSGGGFSVVGITGSAAFAEAVTTVIVPGGGVDAWDGLDESGGDGRK